MVARYQTDSRNPFDLLSCIGQDSVGALQLVAQGRPVPDVKRIECKPLSDAELEQILTSYQQRIPLGTTGEEGTIFRISIAGAQERPRYSTSTTVGAYRMQRPQPPTLSKLPIGKIESHSYSIDLSPRA